MPRTVARPKDLPDFSNPPLNEVTLGVQFLPPSGYQQIRAGEVWDLYKEKYPDVQEHPPLMPNFEIFGLPNAEFSMSPQIGFINGGIHNRFWFLSTKSDELIQFQQDRLLHNWRKVGDGVNEYPRFESTSAQFRDELYQLEQYVNGLSSQTLSINQCEMSYVNHIFLGEIENSRISDWIRFLNFADRDPDFLSIGFGETILGTDSKPQGRLYCEMSRASTMDGRSMIVLTLTVRGKPVGADIESALQFMATGRNLIVHKFAELTTDLAHKIWGRKN